MNYQHHGQQQQYPGGAASMAAVTAAASSIAIPTTEPRNNHHRQQEMVDYGAIKHLLSEAEMEAQQSKAHLDQTAEELRAMQSQHSQAKAVHDACLAKVNGLKSQFKGQIMEEALRQHCRWNDMYYRLIEWKEAHGGDTSVPCGGEGDDEEVKKLNRWVVNQRTAYKYFMNGDKKHIKDHRIDALNKVREREK